MISKIHPAAQNAFLHHADDAPSGPFSYVDFYERFKRTCRAPDVDKRSLMMEEMKGLLRRLHVEEAALQFLVYRLAHMHLELKMRVPLDIRRNLRDEKVTRYASEYELTEKWAAPREGGPAMVLHPVGDRAGCATLVICRGTLSWDQYDVLARPTWPTGLRDDVHMRGVGHTSCGWLAPRFIDLARQVRDEGRELILVGHSLGAAVATGLLAKLPADARDHVHLLSYKPPGVAPSIAAAILPDAKRVRVIEHCYDVVGWFGRSKPAGTRIKVRGLAGVPARQQVPHAVPQLAVWELTQMRGDFTIKQKEHVRNGWLILEAARVGAGIVAGWALPR